VSYVKSSHFDRRSSSIPETYMDFRQFRLQCVFGSQISMSLIKKANQPLKLCLRRCVCMPANFNVMVFFALRPASAIDQLGSAAIGTDALQNPALDSHLSLTR